MFLLSLLQNMLFFTGSYSNNVFPEPLSEKEEKEALSKLQTGDEEARNMLIEHNLRLVAHIVKKFEVHDYDTDDLISIGTIGLIKGVDTYKPDKNIKLTTYIAKCIQNEILMYFRANNKNNKNISLNEPVGFDKEGNEIRLLDIMESGEPPALEQIGLKDDTKKLYRLLEQILPERERQVLVMRYGLYQGKEYTQREIAGKLGISRSYISRIEKNALHHLREYFQD